MMMEEKFFSPNKKAILIFIFTIFTVVFYESKRIILWETQRPKQQNEICSWVVLAYAQEAEKIKEKTKLESFFQKENAFWLKLKKSPIVFEEKKLPQLPVIVPEIKENKIEETEKKIEKMKGPFRILIIGDSFMAVYGGLGDPLERELLNYKDVKVFRLGRVSSGLSRPDYFNWNLTIKELISKQNPNIAIVMLGLNDPQALTTPEGKVVVNFVKFGKEEWIKEYQKRVSEVMTTFEKNNIFVFWLGLPITRDQKFNEKIKILNKIYETEAKNHQNVKFIPTWDLLTDEKGNYIHYLMDEKKRKRLLRLSDGIHLTYFGGGIVVKEIIKKMEEVMELELKSQKTPQEAQPRLDKTF